MEHLSNEEKIKEICECSHCSLIEDISPQQKEVTCKRCVLSHKVREMAQWKDEQHKELKEATQTLYESARKVAQLYEPLQLALNKVFWEINIKQEL